MNMGTVCKADSALFHRNPSLAGGSMVHAARLFDKL